MSYFLKSDVFEYNICCSGVGQIESVWKKVRGGGVMVMHNFTKVKSGEGGGGAISPSPGSDACVFEDDESNLWSVKWACTVLNYDGQISGSSKFASQIPTASTGFRPYIYIGVF